MATIAMVSAAVVGTTYSLFFANGSMKTDMHRQQVARMVEQEVEYWVGRIYLASQDMPNAQELMGSGGVFYRTTILDPDGPKPIQVRFFYDPIVARGVYQPSLTTPALPAFYVVTVWAEWDEPDGKSFKRTLGNEVSFTTYAVPGGIGG